MEETRKNDLACPGGTKKSTSACIFGLLLLVTALFPRGTEALTLSPPHFDYSLNAGDSILDVVKLFNETDTTEVFYPIAMNFGASNNEDGTPRFYPASEDRLGEGMGEWISIETSRIELAPGGRYNLPFSINLPNENVKPGGHYGAILLSSSLPSSDGGSVGVAAQLATIILVRVSGDVQEIGSIAEFGFSDPQSWYDHLPIEMFMRFENAGNVHLKPTGNLIIENWYGRKVADILINPEFKNVLPLSIRRFVFGWGSGVGNEETGPLEMEFRNFALGKYTARLVISYGTSSQVLLSERTFYVWPWRLMLVIGVGLIALLIILAALKRVYDRSLIRRFSRTKSGRF
ncbi:hypothetical protein COY93_03440 [Candidatus Uhrbacteria bacterium CG_4_10_14_0_8_um_filter_58_22]|uniref:DUF916 domain-containing protein n=1 Tax=Candidatus Uhrbacteria bacterium CG_4_10_14_0_8_um_filter_58_22 TaxID=1975029 RepID=A0A2M7QAC4_9BACT|nr:MAG: hypothetical protein AUJ19_02780 [Parcubacteria group bacterium CG1_02_58_44]PIY62316.1 MAG: hypothetical protein COY93_03440 [Candidatus Uhrbacteria bacterium CG_4_10_14_0_8_um_filter_58_22]